MKKIYMYPKNDYETLESPNPYVPNVEAALSEKHIIINQTPNYKGVLELFPNIFKADVFFFNWIEDIPIKKYGVIQTFLFPFFILLSKIFGKKIIWVLHNKFSHERKHRRLIKFNFKLMIKHSDLILTHSNAGVEFVKERFPKYVSKVKYIIHPVEPMFPVLENTEKIYDLLIWGTIHPYKGVIDFLKYAKNKPEIQNIKIALSGICPDPVERKQLNELLTDNITYINNFQDIDEIAKLANQSRYVLFTYNSESILSSGSFMDSIRMGSCVIGPNKGAFKDLNSYSFVETYNTFDEISAILVKKETDNVKIFREIEDFCVQNTWKLFGDKLINASDGIL
jgi:beta-1,4-mannosyltransferase